MTPIGATLAGKYAVRRLLGRGGMGAVYEAEHVEIGRRVAIKLIDRELGRSEETAERFRREARAAARIESEHIVGVSDVGDDPEWGLYMVMELLSGEDLAARLSRDKKIPVKEAVDIAYQIARGLSKAHDAGVIHRDLKPANIFLAQRDGGRLLVKIVDFGVSKLMASNLAEGDRKVLTRHGVTMGTPQYMAPEQVQGGIVGVNTDVWALGALLYEMVAGRPAYERLETYEQTVLAIVLQRPPKLAEIAPWVPAAIIDVVMGALEPDLKKRVPDCGTFADQLVTAMPEAFPEPVAITNRKPAPVPPARAAAPTEPESAELAELPPPTPRKLPQLVAMGVLLVAAIIVGIGLGVRKSKRDDTFVAPPATAATKAATIAPASASSAAAVSSSSAVSSTSAVVSASASAPVWAPPSSSRPIVANAASAKPSTSASTSPSTEASGEPEMGSVGVSSTY